MCDMTIELQAEICASEIGSLDRMKLKVDYASIAVQLAKLDERTVELEIERFKLLRQIKPGLGPISSL